MIDLKKPIHRSKRDATIGGVCGGLASWAGWHTSVVRVAWIFVSIFTGVVPGIATLRRAVGLSHPRGRRPRDGRVREVRGAQAVLHACLPTQGFGGQTPGSPEFARCACADRYGVGKEA